MVVHIAPIGEHTEHVIEWLREITPVKKIHLLYAFPLTQVSKLVVCVSTTQTPEEGV